MKTRNVIGQRVVAVRQWRPCRGRSNTGGGMHVEYLELENGARLYPHVMEGEGEYGVDFTVQTKRQRGER